MNYKDLQAGIAANVKAEITSPVRIAIIGVGGGGSNAVDNMVKAKLKVETFMAINTDLQALRVSKATKRIQIGSNLTKGFGAGADAEKGKKAAEESKDTIINLIKDMDLVFITAGMGGGTGTGAAPVVAQYARELGKLTVAFVTTPFLFEGPVRMRNAQMGIANLRKYVDSIVIISNERLLSVAKDLTIQKAFAYADDVLRQGVQAITDLIMNPNTINVDFADVCNVLRNGGDAVMGIGQASGTNRAVVAVQKAVNNSVLGMTIEGASKVIINIEGGTDALIDENARAVEIVRSICDDDVEIIYGTGTVPALQDSIQVTIIATGFKKPLAANDNSEVKPVVKQPTPPPSQLNLFDAVQAPPERPAPPPPVHTAPPPVAPDVDGTGKVSLSDAEMNWWKRLNNK